MERSKTIGVIGAGAMGSGIAQVAAASGANVILFDADKAALDKAKLNLGSGLKKLEEKGKIGKDEGKKILDRIHFASAMSEFEGCGLVIEAIIENLTIKQKVFFELEKIVHQNTVLASNTSSLSIASIAASCKDASRVVGIHFFNPAQLMPLVEIIPAITTSPAITSFSVEAVRSLGKVPVVAKDTPGFIVNRVARSYYGESIRIYEEGIADIATIDWALKTFGGFRMGPFELMDFIGNDINYKVTESVWEQFFYEQRFKPSLTQKRLFEAKLFGRKSGKGYYNYAEGAVLPEPVKDEALGKIIFNRVIAMLINEAVDSVYLKLASKEDIDLAMTKGVNYPKGLLKWCDDLGQNAVLNILNELYDEYQEDRYRPSLLLKKMVREKNKFYA
jgi:3-hydroxybutyryl-CoA dehydrogenase